MAGVTEAHRDAADFCGNGRKLQLITLTKSAGMSQDDIDASMTFLAQTNTIVGMDGFSVGATGAIYVLLEGETVAADGTDACGVSGNVLAQVAVFDN